MNNPHFKIPEKLKFFIDQKARFKVCYGGRGSGKSTTIAICLLGKALQKPIRILCTRELQNSITDSVHKLLSDLIYLHKLDKYFIITQTSIRTHSGSEFIFKGIRSNINEIKSLEGINICWVEEASKVSANSWDILIPTIRKEDSEIWASFNPDLEEDETYQRFVINNPPDCISVKVNWDDNPYFPEVLRKQMEYDKIHNPLKYDNVWAGLCKQNSEAQVFFGKWEIQDFETPLMEEIKNNRFFFGADWGFASDPSTLVRCFIKENKLYIDYEAYGVGVEIDELPQLFSSVPLANKWEILADSARPETISYLRNRGWNINSAKKGAGSVEEGIEFLRNFEKIIIHPRCKNVIDEMKFYSYKVDRISGKVLPIVIDAHNHMCDGLRYALEDYMRNQNVMDVIFY
jgi:phage terminase large subunit